MQSNRIKQLFLVMAMIGLSACAIKPPVTTDYDTAFDFSTLKTYAWAQSKEKNPVSTLEGKRQKNAIETILNRKGFVKTLQSNQADFLLKTHTITDKKVNIDHFYNNWGYRYNFYPYRHRLYPYHYSFNAATAVREYKIGMLILDIIDPQKKQVIWQGTVSKPLGLYKNRTPEEHATIALLNAQQMLASFPPGKVKP